MKVYVTASMVSPLLCRRSCQPTSRPVRFQLRTGGFDQFAGKKVSSTCCEEQSNHVCMHSGRASSDSTCTQGPRCPSPSGRPRISSTPVRTIQSRIGSIARKSGARTLDLHLRGFVKHELLSFAAASTFDTWNFVRPLIRTTNVSLSSWLGPASLR